MSTAAIPAPAPSAPASAPAPSTPAPSAPAATPSGGSGPVDIGAEVDSWFDSPAPAAPATTPAPTSEPAPSAPSEGDSPEFLRALEETTGEPAPAPEAAPTEPPAPEPVVAPPPPPDAQAAALDEDGVSVDAAGRKVKYFSEARAEHVLGQARISQDIAQAFGAEALTPELARDIANDSKTLLDIQERLCQPGQSQESAFQYLLSESMAAYAQGAISVDPSESIGQSFLNAAAKAAPRVAESIKATITSTLVSEMYDRAIKARGTGAETPALALAQRLDNALNGKFKTLAELLAAPKADDPATILTRREQELSRREAAIEGARLDKFRQGLGADRAAVMAEEISAQLAPVEERLKNLPADGAGEFRTTLNARLRQEVSRQLKDDHAFNENMNRLWERAKNARADEVRGQLAQQMKSAYKLKVAQVLRGSAPKIISALTAGFASSNTDRHQQIAATQRQVATAPVATGPVPATVPLKTAGGGYLNPHQVGDIIDKILS